MFSVLFFGPKLKVYQQFHLQNETYGGSYIFIYFKNQVFSLRFSFAYQEL